MKKIMLSYLIGLTSFLILDSLWLGVVAYSMYQEQLNPIVNLEFNLVAATIFYTFYVAGIVYFAIIPGLNKKSWKKGLINGTL